MSTVIAHIKDNNITLGVDSQITRGNHKDTESKIFNADDYYYVVGTGTLSDISLFFTVFMRELVEIEHVSIDDIFDCYKKTAELKKSITTEACDSTIYIYCKDEEAGDKLFILHYDGFIRVYHRSDTLFTASGSGMEYAYGAYYMGATVEQCLEASAKYDTSTSAPFTIVTL